MLPEQKRTYRGGAGIIDGATDITAKPHAEKADKKAAEPKENMKNCKYCKVKVNTEKERCPVCKNALEGEVSEGYISEFPATLPPEKDVILKKIFNMIFVGIVGFFAISLILTIILPDYNAWWSFFLGLSVVSAFVIVRNAVLSDKNLPRRIGTAAVLTVGVCVLIDGLFLHVLHETPEINIPWSILFVLPGIPSGVIIAYIVLMFANKKYMSDFYVYLFFAMLFNLIPLIIYNVWGVYDDWGTGYKYAVYGCVILDIATVGLFSAVNFKSIIEEIKKKLHI